MRLRRKRGIAALFGVAIMLFAGITALGPALADNGDDAGSSDGDAKSVENASDSSKSSGSSKNKTGPSSGSHDSKGESDASTDSTRSSEADASDESGSSSSDAAVSDTAEVDDTTVAKETAKPVVDASAKSEEEPQESTAQGTVSIPPPDAATTPKSGAEESTTDAESPGETWVAPATGDDAPGEEVPEESTDSPGDDYVGTDDGENGEPAETGTDEGTDGSTDAGKSDKDDQAQDNDEKDQDGDKDRDKDAKNDDDDDDDEDSIFRTVRGGRVLGGFHQGNIFSRHSGFFSDGGLFTLFPTRGLPLRVNPSDEVFGFANRACDGGRFGIGLGDFSSRSVDSRDVSQRVSVDRDSALLAIALANSGVSGVDFNSIRNVDFRARESSSFRQDSRLDRDDVLFALALGIGPRARGLDTLACIADISERTERTVEFSRSLTLNPDTVLLAIAFKNAVGGPLSLQDVANFDERSRVTESVDRDVDIDREDALNAIALGGGRRR